MTNFAQGLLPNCSAVLQIYYCSLWIQASDEYDCGMGEFPK